MQAISRPFKEEVRNISPKNRTIIDKYLKTVREKQSIKSARMQKSVIERCIVFINKPISEITRNDILNFVEKEIEDKDYAFVTKRNYCAFIRMFFRIMVFKRIVSINPVPYPKDLIDMNCITSVNCSIDEENPFEKADQKVEEDVYTKDEVFEILKLAKGKNHTDFIIFGLLASTGARISEILSIRVNYIDFERRMIYTGLENGARKSTHRKHKRMNPNEQKGIFFCFPERFGYYIKQYIQRNGRRGNDFLFQSTKFDKQRNEYKHYTHNTFYVGVCERYGKKYGSFHKFRDTLITLRRIELDCPLDRSQMLVNHSVKDVHTNFYTKPTLEDRKKFYDSYFPYKTIPYF